MKPFDAHFKKMMMHYGAGFVGSIVLTLLAFWLAYEHLVSGTLAAVIVLVLGLTQAGVQAYFFLHLGEEAKPRWRNYSFFFMTTMIAVVVVGLLWVIINLNYNMNMSPEQMQQYMIEQNKKGF